MKGKKRFMRVLILGLDALVPTIVEKFVKEGKLPTFERMMKKGCFSRILPVIPAQTPANWFTIATGARPGTHGVIQWGTHLQGEAVDEMYFDDAFNSGLCKAELIWETLARFNMKSVVMNYPGYPPTTDKVIFIDALYSPTRSYFDLAGPALYNNIIEKHRDFVEFIEPPSYFRKKFNKKSAILYTELPVWPSTVASPLIYPCIMTAESGIYDKIYIFSQNDRENPVAILKKGEWSDWIIDSFATEAGTLKEGAFRFKLVDLTSDGKVKIYRSDAFPVDGSFCSDSIVGKELIERFGPYTYSATSLGLHFKGLLDLNTMEEIIKEEIRWWSEAAGYAMEKIEGRLLILHWHIPDSVGHVYSQFIDPSSSSFSPEKAEEAWKIFEKYYIMADNFVSAFCDKFKENTTVIVVSDHGMPANKKAVSLVNLFLDKGWLTLSDEGKSVDWSRSKVFFAQNHLWINLEGVYKGGIVKKEEYLSLRKEIINLLRDLKDPETGEHVFSFVLPKEHAAIVGLTGSFIGDVVYCYEGGYRWSGDEVLRIGERRVIFPSGGGNHGPMIPAYETDVLSVMGCFFIMGDKIRQGYIPPKEEQAGISTCDIAPTVCAILGIDPPAQNEGHVLTQFFSDSLPPPVRSLKTLKRNFVVVKKQEGRVVLKGDVTDEN